MTLIGEQSLLQAADPAVVESRIEDVAVVAIGRPESHNALSSEVLTQLLGAVTQAADSDATALVLTGSGRTFCSGGDLAGVGVALDGDIDRELGRLVDELHAFIAAVRSLPMPVVAAINGPAIGAGIALAMAADVRVIAKQAFFLPGYLAVGASPDGGTSFHLARALGESQALAALLLNRKLSAETLLELGMVDEVAEISDVHDRSVAMAGRLAQLSMPSVLAARDLVFGAASHSLAEHLDAEKQHFLAVAKTSAFKASVAPFLRRSADLPT